MAYNLPYARLTRLPATGGSSQPATSATPDSDAVAWVIDWRQLQAPGLLQELLEADARVRAATKPFSMGGSSFSEGSLVLLAGIQDEDKSDAVYNILQKAASEGIQIQSYNTQVTQSGPGFGTAHFKIVPRVKPLLLVGEGVRSYDAGEAWFELDQRLGVAPVMVEIARLGGVDLADYTHLILVDGKYSKIGKSLKKRITEWVKTGGVIIASHGAATWAESLCFKPEACDKKQDEKLVAKTETKPMPYADFEDQRAQRTIGGAIVSAQLDNTHPIAFGFDSEMPIFRRGTTLLQGSDNPFTTPVRYTKKPLVSGYIGAQRLAEISNQPAVIAERHDKGLVIRFANNPLFRGFWRGTERLWVNSIYFGPVVRTTELP